MDSYNKSTGKTDFLGREIFVGMPVVFVAGKYVELKRGVVIGSTPQKLRVVTHERWGNGMQTTEALFYPKHCASTTWANLSENGLTPSWQTLLDATTS